MVNNIHKNINEDGREAMAVEGEESQEWQEAMESGRRAELKMRIRQADQEMSLEDEPEEEGPVNSLVRLSNKVRCLVRNMLV